MKAVHFGAGNIGRGFIGLLLYQSGYETVFVDVNEDTIRELNGKREYTVLLAAEDRETSTVKQVSGINSVKEPEKVIQAIAEADIVTTAVGPNVLVIISELIAKGLKERLNTNRSELNLIACENMVGGSTLLKENIYKHIDDEDKGDFDALFGFPDAAVDRIVPNQKNEDLLTVSVEPYFEWVVEETALKGKRPEIEGITYVDNLKPYIERKLFTVNTGHAIPAYIGYYLGYATITEAMEDKKVQEIIEGALKESGEGLIRTYGFNEEEHHSYIDKIIERFRNPYISDEVTRVARGPLRKLGGKDRLVRPALMYMETTGNEPVFLGKVIAAALEYGHEADEEAVKLKQMIARDGMEKTLENVAGLDSGHPLIETVKNQIAELKTLRQ